MATNCLFTFVFSPFLSTWIYLFYPKNCSEHQKKTIFGVKQVNSGKNCEKHKSKQTIACHVLALNWRKYGAVSHLFGCKRLNAGKLDPLTGQKVKDLSVAIISKAI